jgi:hypothetical protein
MTLIYFSSADNICAFQNARQHRQAISCGGQMEILRCEKVRLKKTKGTYWSQAYFGILLGKHIHEIALLAQFKGSENTTLVCSLPMLSESGQHSHTKPLLLHLKR